MDQKATSSGVCVIEVALSLLPLKALRHIRLPEKVYIIYSKENRNFKALRKWWLFYIKCPHPERGALLSRPPDQQKEERLEKRRNNYPALISFAQILYVRQRHC